MPTVRACASPSPAPVLPSPQAASTGVASTPAMSPSVVRLFIENVCLRGVSLRVRSSGSGDVRVEPQIGDGSADADAVAAGGGDPGVAVDVPCLEGAGGQPQPGGGGLTRSGLGDGEAAECADRTVPVVLAGFEVRLDDLPAGPGAGVAYRHVEQDVAVGGVLDVQIGVLPVGPAEAVTEGQRGFDAVAQPAAVSDVDALAVGDELAVGDGAGNGYVFEAGRKRPRQASGGLGAPEQD